jgi:hypothetical protein
MKAGNYFCYSSFRHDSDKIRMLNGRQPVGDDENGSALRDGIQSLLHNLL